MRSTLARFYENTHIKQEFLIKINTLGEDRMKLSNKLAITILAMVAANSALAVPPVTGDPVIVKHIGSMDWPVDNIGVAVPFLTQGDANALNDLHGEARCDVLISTPGNYHMALQDLMYGRADLNHPSLVNQIKDQYGLTVCWTTSPPISQEQIPAEVVQFGNLRITGKPVLAMGPKGKMNNLVANGLVDPSTVKNFLRNRGNAILVRDDEHNEIKGICDLAKTHTRLVSPRPPARPGEAKDLASEPGSFGNFSGTLFNVINDNNDLSCNGDAEAIFNSYFAQDLSKMHHLDDLNNVFNHKKLLKVYKNHQVKWVASSRIMHRDVPYALCNDYADAGIIFFHLAKYLQREAAKFNCPLKVIPMGGTAQNPVPMAGNRVGTLRIAKVKGDFSSPVSLAADLIYNTMTTNGGAWEAILNSHEIDFPN